MSTTTPTRDLHPPAAGNGKSSSAKKRKNRSPFADFGAAADEDRWPQWTEHLKSRSKPADLTELLATRAKSPLRWGVADGQAGQAAKKLIKRLHRSMRRKRVDAADAATQLEQWLTGASAISRPDAQFGLECLAWCHTLPSLSSALPAAPWCELYEFLARAAEESAGLSLDDDPLAHQLLAGELPLTLCYLLPELDRCTQFAGPARSALSAGLVELLDGEGLPHARHLDILRALLACWTRCLHMGRTMKKSCFDKDATVQYEWLVRQSLRLTRRDGSQMFGPPEGAGRDTELLSAALAANDDRDDNAIASSLLSREISTRNKARADKLPSPAVHSEWSESAVLRPNWTPGAPSLAVTYSDRTIRAELNDGRDTLITGACNPQVEIDGQPAGLKSDWEEVCWHTDRDGDYLELEATLENEWRIQRQILLARRENFAYIADALLGDAEADIAYRCRFPLGEPIRFKPADETNEGVLQGNKRVANVLPLALPEWRSDRGCGALQGDEGGVELSMSSRGSGLYAPLFFDLDSRRVRKPFTWRRLTVAHRLQTEPIDAAAGFRVAAGSREQWLVFRSLTEKRDRTLLGQHLFCEFLFARFAKDGEVDELIEID